MKLVKNLQAITIALATALSACSKPVIIGNSDNWEYLRQTSSYNNMTQMYFTGGKRTYIIDKKDAMVFNAFAAAYEKKVNMLVQEGICVPDRPFDQVDVRILDDLFDEADTNKDGIITPDETEAYYQRLKGYFCPKLKTIK